MDGFENHSDGVLEVFCSGGDFASVEWAFIEDVLSQGVFAEFAEGLAEPFIFEFGIDGVSIFLQEPGCFKLEWSGDFVDEVGRESRLLEPVAADPLDSGIGFECLHHVVQVVGEGFDHWSDFEFFFEEDNGLGGVVGFEDGLNAGFDVVFFEFDWCGVFDFDCCFEGISGLCCESDPIFGGGFGMEHSIGSGDESGDGKKLGIERAPVVEVNRSGVLGVEVEPRGGSEALN